MTEKALQTTEIKESPQRKALREAGVKRLVDKGSKDKETYLIWRSMPAMLRSMREEDLKRMGYAVDDPVFKLMLKIKTKKEFCEIFKVGHNQPAHWESNPEFMARVNKLSVEDHVMRFRADVDFSFTQKVIRHGDAHRVKLWKQLHEGWTEKVEHRNLNVSMTPADLVASIEARNKAIRDKKEAV